MRFAAEYCVDLNARQAAIRAGAPPRGASVTAARYLRDPEVQALIRRLQAGHIRKVGLSAERTLEELRRLACVDPADCYDDQGDLLPLRDMPEHVRSAIASIEMTGTGTGKRLTRIRFWSKPAALELLAKHQGLLEEKITVDAGRGILDAIAAGREHARRMLGPISRTPHEE